MRIVCPTCETVHHIKDGRVPRKKATGKCTQCGARLIIDPGQPAPGVEAALPYAASRNVPVEKSHVPGNVKMTAAPDAARPLPAPVRDKPLSAHGGDKPAPAGNMNKPFRAGGTDRPIPPQRVERRVPAPKKPMRSDLGKAGSAWRRIVAFALDMGLVAGATFAMTIVLPASFQIPGLPALGLFGALATLYFGILQSSPGKGQTFGKYIAGIQVLDQEGLPLSFVRSVVRFMFTALPACLAVLALPPKTGASAIDATLTAAFLGICLFDVYLFLFGGPMGQSLHDMMLGTYVVAAPKAGRVGREPLWNA